MLHYIIRRLLWMPIVLIAVSFITFALGYYGPGDPIQVLMGQHADPEVLARIRHERGLDRPFLIQYLDYLWRTAHGDFGESYMFRGQPVGGLIMNKVWVSAQLGIVATIIGVATGIPLGLIAALRQGTWMDTTIVGLTLLWLSIPVFVTAPILLFVFAFKLHLLPTYGWGGMLDVRIIMPAFVLGLGPVAGLTRLMRASTLDVIGQDYIRTARAKGLLERVVVGRHIARNALLPILTVLGLSLATLVEGAFITETFFGIPGIGRLAVDSLFARDYPIIMAMTLLVAVAYVLANLLVDVGYTFLDPRIRYR